VGGEEELRHVSAATAGCWELRFQCAVAGDRRVLRRLAGLDGSQGTSADNEVAVVGNSRDEPEPGQTARGEVVTTLSSGAAEEPAGAWLATAGRSAGRSRNRDVGLQWSRGDVIVVVVKADAGSVSGCSGRPPNTGSTAGSSEEIVRPSSAFVVR